MSREPLTQRQSDCYEFIVRHHADRGYPPTYRAIAEALGVNVNAAAELVQRLVRKGYLEIRKERRGVIYPVLEVAV